MISTYQIKKRSNCACNRIRHEDRSFSIYNLECWNCHKRGHIAKNCPEKKPPICFACGDIGHIRRECQKVKCIRCGKNGHRTRECYSRMRYETYRTDGNVRNSWRYNGKRINVIEENNEEQLREDPSTNDQEGYEIIYPKGKAPLVGELVGAIN